MTGGGSAGTILYFSEHPDFGSHNTRAGVTPANLRLGHIPQCSQSKMKISSPSSGVPKLGMTYIAGMVRPPPSMVLTLPDTRMFWIITMSPMAMPMFP